jgi:hypothetical protein
MREITVYVNARQLRGVFDGGVTRRARWAYRLSQVGGINASI